MLKVSFVDPGSILVDGNQPDQDTLKSLQDNMFTYDPKSRNFDLTLSSKPGTVVTLAKKRMFIETYEQK